MEQQIPKMEAWKDTFLIFAGLGALVIGLAAYFQHQPSLIWSTAFTVCVSLAALHARWGSWFTRRLLIFGSLVTLVTCAIWQANMSKPEKPTPPIPQTSRQLLAPSDLPTFREKSDTVVITVGTVSQHVPLDALEGRSIPFAVSAFGESYNPIHIGLKDGKPFVDVTVWAGHNEPAVEIKQNEFTVRPLNWDSNTTKTALEVVDDKGDPVLQVYYRNPYRISVSGKFTHPSGDWVFATDGGFWINPTSPPTLKPIFKYPSWKYPGEYADNQK